MTDSPSTAALGPAIGKGALAGLAGSAAMTAFQLLVEMPLTGRSESYAPARFATKILPFRPKRRRSRRRLNYVAHAGIGAGWGAGHGAIAHLTGLRGARAVTTVFGVQYTGDVLLNTAIGVYEPSRWSARDVFVDLVDKALLAAVTGAVFDRVRGQPAV